MHFKYRKESKEYYPKMSPIFGHSLPRYGLWLPSTGAVDAHLVGYGCPCNGHKQTNRRAQKAPDASRTRGLKSSFNYFMKTQPSKDGCL